MVIDRESGGAADKFQIDRDPGNHLGKGKGRQHHIDAPGSQDWKRNRKGDDAGKDHREGNAKPDGQFCSGAGIEPGTGIGAEGNEAGSAEVKLTGGGRQKNAIGIDNAQAKDNQLRFKITAHQNLPLPISV